MHLPESVDFIQVSDTSWKLKIYSKEGAEVNIILYSCQFSENSRDIACWSLNMPVKE